MLKKILFLFLIQQSLVAQTTQILRGTVKELHTDKKIIGANLQLSNANLATQSDSNGVFRFDKIPTGRYSLKISCVGFESLLIPEILLDAGKENILDVQLAVKNDTLATATVLASSLRHFGSAEVITQEQVLRFPATFFDPARLATAFAGVVNDNDQANGMVIRGNSPNFMQWRLEGVEIVNPNHLSNAGTFSDRSTLNAGGVNALSAQLLGTSTLLKGALPAQYGNALSGVMDMRLRKGNNEKYEFTASAGLIGFDFAAEGPFSKKGKSSFLVNYRYSFTGLLGAMGVSFGGEDIRFQDLSFNLSFPTKKLGDFTIFGVLGRNSNTLVENQDPLQKRKDIKDYLGFMNIFGLTHTKILTKKLLWKSTLATSETESKILPVLESFYSLFTYHKINTFLSSLSYKINHKNTLKTGIEINSTSFDRITQILPGSYSSTDPNLTDYVILGIMRPYMQPHLSWEYTSKKLTSTIGLRYISYPVGNVRVIEPRASFNYILNNRQSIFGAYSMNSKLFPFAIHSDFGHLRANHFTFGHQYQINPLSSIKTEIYLQHSYHLPNFYNIYPQSIVNVVEDVVYNNFSNYNSFGFNTGIEVSYQRYLNKGFYMLSNFSLYRITYSIGYDASRKKRIYEPSYFDGDFTTNLTIGKELVRTKNRILGLNLRVIYRGGFKDVPIDIQASKKAGTTIFKSREQFSVKQANYFRPDLSIYWKKNKKNHTRTLSLDIQNVANYQNQGMNYYNADLQKVVRNTQLGIIPVLNYRVNF